MASTFSVIRKQGIDWIFNIAAQSAGVAQDITGYVIKLELQDMNGNDVLDLSIGSGITVTTPTSGIAQFRVTGAQTQALAVGRYRVFIKGTAPGVGAQSDDWADGYLVIQKGLIS